MSPHAFSHWPVREYCSLISKCLQELFGPLSMRALERDQYCRQTAGYLPEASVAFIDEVFKANSSILNTLLTVMNERLFDNGSSRTKVPLKCLVSAILMLIRSNMYGFEVDHDGGMYIRIEWLYSKGHEYHQTPICGLQAALLAWRMTPSVQLQVCASAMLACNLRGFTVWWDSWSSGFRSHGSRLTCTHGKYHNFADCHTDFLRGRSGCLDWR